MKERLYTANEMAELFNPENTRIGSIFFKDGSIKDVINARLEAREIFLRTEEGLYLYSREVKKFFIKESDITLYADSIQYYTKPVWNPVNDIVSATIFGVHCGLEQGD